MRILHVISSIDYGCGGPTAALVGLASAQVKAGLSVSVVATARPGENASAAPDLRAAGVEAEVIGPAPGRLMRHPQIVPTLMRRIGQSDLVHVHALWEQIQHDACRLARQRGVPYLVTPHGMLDPWALSQSRWKKRIYLAWRLRRDLSRAAAIHVNSEYERARAQELGLPTPFIVVPNGIDTREFQDLPPPEVFRQKHPHIGDRCIVLFLGRIHPSKGLAHLAPAFASVQRDAVLVMAGPDHQGHRAQIEALIERMRMRDRVLFTGLLRGRERIEALSAAELFVLPSHQDSFGIAVVEALAAGTPVIVSDRVGIGPEVAAEGLGAVVPLEQQALAREMDRWLSDPSLRNAAAGKARSYVLSHYGWDQIAGRWKKEYSHLTGRTGAGS